MPFLDNYRKAQKGEVTCSECKYNAVRFWSNRLECRFANVVGSAYAVGKKHTCDVAKPSGIQVEE